MTGTFLLIWMWTFYLAGFLLDAMWMALTGSPFPISTNFLAFTQDGPWWVWITGQLFHQDLGHIVGNSIYVFVGWWLMAGNLARPRTVLTLLMLALPITLALFNPAGAYLGTSAIASGMVVAGIFGATKKHCVWRVYLPLVLLIILPDIAGLAIGSAGIGYAAHLIGAGIGLTLAGLFEFTAAREDRCGLCLQDQNNNNSYRP